MKNFNKFHPELRDGEMFLANVPEEPYNHGPLKGGTAFERIGYETKRLGHQAYKLDGMELPRSMRPVFIKVDEYVARGGDPDKLNRDVIPDPE